ncbi:hypothetical protein [Kitasatospora sp. NPDC056184]|uniref:hypothetical protein n=1 Tax=Kitasatospora sp. NPDC056184 TaxID=3345738 RepID=UPI0035D9E3F7
MADIEVGPELRASAGVARALGGELAGPVKAAQDATATAAGQLTGWSVGGALAQLGREWVTPLSALQKRLVDTGVKLETSAEAHSRTERALVSGWKEGVQ